MSHRLVFTRFAVSLFGLAASACLAGCPAATTCPNCITKQGKFEIPDRGSLPVGCDSIIRAQLTHSVDYASHCPPPSFEEPPCTRIEAIALDVLETGRHVRTLPLATDSNQDSESAVVTLVLSCPGGPDQEIVLDVVIGD